MPRVKQEHRRLRRRLEVRYGPEAPRYVAYSRNISRTGIMVGATRVFAPGTLLHLELAVRDLTLQALGVVVWAREGPVQWLTTGRIGMGITFVEPCRELLEALGTDAA